MTDILLRNIPEADVRAIDVRAAALGLSRNEYLRRTLAQVVRVTSAPAEPPSLSALHLFAEAFSDLTDDDVLKAAWE